MLSSPSFHRNHKPKEHHIFHQRSACSTWEQMREPTRRYGWSVSLLPFAMNATYLLGRWSRLAVLCPPLSCCSLQSSVFTLRRIQLERLSTSQLRQERVGRAEGTAASLKRRLCLQHATAQAPFSHRDRGSGRVAGSATPTGSLSRTSSKSSGSFVCCWGEASGQATCPRATLTRPRLQHTACAFPVVRAPQHRPKAQRHWYLEDLLWRPRRSTADFPKLLPATFAIPTPGSAEERPQRRAAVMLISRTCTHTQA